jgi:hypothetical protein
MIAGGDAATLARKFARFAKPSIQGDRGVIL